MASGAVTAVTGPDGRTVRYGYNSQRQVTSVTYRTGFAAAGSMMRREGWRRRPHAAVRRRVTAMMTRRVSCRQGYRTRRAVQNRWHGAVTVNCWPSRTARGTRRGMSTTGTVNKSPFTGRKASALTAVITRVGKWSVRRMRRGVKPVMSTAPQET